MRLYCDWTPYRAESAMGLCKASHRVTCREDRISTSFQYRSHSTISFHTTDFNISRVWIIRGREVGLLCYESGGRHFFSVSSSVYGSLSDKEPQAHRAGSEILRVGHERPLEIKDINYWALKFG